MNIKSLQIAKNHLLMDYLAIKDTPFRCNTRKMLLQQLRDITKELK